MYIAFVVFGVIALVAVVVLSKRGSTVSRLLSGAVESGDVGPLVAYAEALPAGQRSAFYQSVIAHLWDTWNRPLAAQVVKEFAKNHSEEKICQYWLKQVIEIEPLAAQRWFDDGFVKRYYNPQVAKSCGRTSS